MAFPRTNLRPVAQIVPAVVFISLLLLFGFQYYHLVHLNPQAIKTETPNRAGNPNNPTVQNLQPIALGARYFLDYPLSPPYKDIFGELGQRARLVRSWIEELQAQANSKKEAQVAELVEQVVVSLFPYLNPLSHANSEYSPPLSDIRNRLRLPTNGTASPTAGIVIPAGDKNLRFACHLITSLTRIHKTKLPIQVVHAGDKDLSTEGRQKLQAAAGDGKEIELLDVLSVFDDSTLQLAKGGWAIKPFAALASRFDEVILLDADTVFFQDPQELLRQDRYIETGVLLFHDRLLWKNGFAERQDWWHEQLKHPSKETEKSLVWTERYSEEGDSGLVVLNKSRLEVLIGLLHVGWQNSYDVRENWTYKITYGDKETWWIGFEATESTYAFSPHYGGIVGWSESPEEVETEGDKPGSDNKLGQGKKGGKESKKDEVRVCSFVIAHVDQTEKPLWYNGGLLKNKIVNQTEFEVPTHWMIDQRWIKGASKDRMSCMVGTKSQELTKKERGVLSRAIDLAKEVDKQLGLL